MLTFFLFASHNFSPREVELMKSTSKQREIIDFFVPAFVILFFDLTAQIYGYPKRWTIPKIWDFKAYI
jgi:hypothetical protein